MATLKIYDAASRRGQRKIDQTLRRGDAVLDAEILAAAEKIVRRIRKKGDKALLKAVRRYDGSKAAAIAVAQPYSQAQGPAKTAGSSSRSVVSPCAGSGSIFPAGGRSIRRRL